MANICSTYIQIYPKKRLDNNAENFQFYKVASELLSSTNGYSYCMPLFVSFGSYGKYLELAFGEKWCPTSINEYFERHHNEIDVIFCRFFDGAGDFDAIKCLSNNHEVSHSDLYREKSRRCRYGFDKIKFQSKSRIDNFNIDPLNDEFYKATISGSYFSESDYCDLGSSSKFNQYKMDDSENAIFDIDRDVQCSDKNLFELIEEQAIVVEYYFKNKLVCYAIDINEYVARGGVCMYKGDMEEANLKWLYFPFDSWYNCVDPLYLKYINKINPLKL